MKKQTKKLQEKNDTELLTELCEQREQMRTIRFSSAGAKGKSTANLPLLRKNIARILTEITRRKNDVIAQ